MKSRSQYKEAGVASVVSFNRWSIKCRPQKMSASVSEYHACIYHEWLLLNLLCITFASTLDMQLMTSSYNYTNMHAYLSILVQHIVGQFQLFKGDSLFGQLVTSEWRVWMHVQPSGQWRVSLASHQPGWPVVGIPVALVVHWHNVHQNGILGVWVESSEGHSEGGKHPSGRDGQHEGSLIEGKKKKVTNTCI